MQTHEAAEMYPLLGGNELNAIVESMRLHGFDPKKPVVLYRGKILDGRNRLAAAELAGVRPVFLELPADCDPYMEAWKHNGARRDLEPDHKAAIMIRTLERSEAWRQEQDAARERANRARTSGRGAGGKFDRRASREARPSKPRKVAHEIATKAAVSRATVERVQELARKAPEDFERVVRGEAKAAEVLRELKRAERIAKLAEISAGDSPIESVGRRYPVIYCDPPWRYEHAISDSRAIENQYPTMGLGEICALRVADISTDDCVLYLWATSPKLEESMRVISAWGFTYRTSMVWVKDKIGPGYWARQRHELLLIATKGSPPTPEPSLRPDSVISAPRGAHSEKPESVREMIARMFPTLPRLEMFCRSPRPGWAVWGNQAG